MSTITTITTENEHWITHFAGTKTNKEQSAQAYLFCFGHAGGSPADFRAWDEDASDKLKVCPVCLPGHGSRQRESGGNDIKDNVESLAARIAPALERYAGSRPCALFGHSYGALLAYETARRMRVARPVLLVVSGRNAPHIPDPRPGEQRCSDAPSDTAFVELVARRYNDTALLDISTKHPEMLPLFLPQLRADIASFEAYACPTPSTPPALSCPICACAGTLDPRVSEEGLAAWKLHTSSQDAALFKVLRFPGDHFYTKAEQSRKTLVAEVEKLVLEAVPKKTQATTAATAVNDYCGTGYCDYNPYEDPNFGFC